MAREIIARGKKFIKYREDTDPPGRFKVEITPHDQHYLDDLGMWQPVVETFEPDTDGFDYQASKQKHRFRIAGGGARRWYPRRDVLTEYVEITGMEYYYRNKWNNLNLPTPVWRSSSVEWDMDQLFARITNTWHQIKTDFILKTENAPTGLRYAISLVGLTLNNWNLYSVADGTLVGKIEAPTAFDANQASVPVTATYEGGYVQWLVQVAGFTYPIDVDPTFTAQPDATDGIDTYTKGDMTTYDGSTSNILAVYSPSSSANYNRGVALIKFDLSELESASITASTLYLYLGGTNWLTWNTPFTVRRILSANSGWTESGACWDYKVNSSARWAGDTGSDGGTDAGCSVSGTDFSSTALGTYEHEDGGSSHDAGYELPVTLDTTEFETLVANNYGIAVLVTASTEPFAWVCSSDHATTSYRPKLVVEYESSSSPQSVSPGGLASAEAFQNPEFDPVVELFYGSDGSTWNTNNWVVSKG